MSKELEAYQGMNNDLVVRENMPLTIKDIRDQVSLIQELMRDVMTDGEHYGTIPGCGNKKTLLKPGAEKLIFLFRYAVSVEDEILELGRGHREYRTKVILHDRHGRAVGQGVGSCSTMESKYRFREGEVRETGKPVPQEYWTLRKSNPIGALALIGGKGHKTKKVNGKWEIVEAGDKVEHDNPADYYNTCRKISKKRAQTDAVLTCTAASDIFTQDIEDMVENGILPSTAEGAPTANSVDAAMDAAETAPKGGKDTKAPQDSPARSFALGAVEKVLVRSGTSGKDNKPWTCYDIVMNDIKYSTFDEKLATAAKGLIGIEAQLEYATKGKYSNAVAIEPVATNDPTTTSDYAPMMDNDMGNDQEPF